MLALTDAGSSPTSVLLFAFAAFTIAAVGLRVPARRAGPAAGRVRALPVALTAVVRRNRRRYGGYLVHVGVAVALLGVAASSAFNTQRDVRLGPGDSAQVAGYDVRYVRPTSDLSSERIAFGAVLDVRKDGKRVTTLRPSRSYFPTQSDAMGPLGRFFRGESTSEVGLETGWTRDVWTAMQPDLRVLNGPIREGQPDRARPAAGGAGRDDRGAHPALRPAGAARDLQADRQPDGDLDLGRRPGRAGRRAGHAVAIPARPGAGSRASARRAWAASSPGPECFPP